MINIWYYNDFVQMLLGANEVNVKDTIVAFSILSNHSYIVYNKLNFAFL